MADDAGSARPGPLPPAVLPYEASAPIPAGYHLESRFRRKLIIGGAVTLGATYLLGAGIGIATSSRNGWLATIPVAGPFLTAGLLKPEPCPRGGCVDNMGDPILRATMVLLGASQVVGAAVLGAGFKSTDVLTRNDSLHFVPVPYAMAHGAGLGLVGSF